MEATCSAVPGTARSVPRTDLFHDVCDALPWFRKSLSEVLSTAVSEAGASKGFILWPGFDEIRVFGRRSQGAVVPISSSAEAELDPRSDSGAGRFSPSPSKRVAGPLLLVFDEAAGETRPASPRLNMLARRAQQLIERHDLYMRAAQTCGVDIASVVVGQADAQRAFESAIVKVSQSDLPVLIEAEFGSDVMGAAAAIHCRSARRDEPLVAFNCASKMPATFRRSLLAALENAGGGSLLLSDVDTLDEVMQRDLLDVLSASGTSGGTDPGVRLFSATTQPLDRLIGDGRFCRFLRTHLELLKIEVPPLRFRRGDICPLIEHQMASRFQSSKKLSDDAAIACERYSWPGNFAELERVVSRLVVMSEQECISMEDLAVHTPFLIRPAEWTESAIPETQAPELPEDPVVVPELETEMEQDLEAISELAVSLAQGNHANLASYGLSIQRALVHVSRQYQTEITLSELAANAYLSVSHLSFLLKKTVGVPFKTLLARVRIEKAKQLLAENPDLSVTEVSLNSGFGDLSHFERTFKRIVGVNPREYRRRISTVRPVRSRAGNAGALNAALAIAGEPSRRIMERRQK